MGKLESIIEFQANFFSDRAYDELLWEMAHGQCPDIWEHERFVMWGRLAILGDIDGQF